MEPSLRSSSSFLSPPAKKKKLDQKSVGVTVLLTGLGKSGKSTIAKRVAEMLKMSRILVENLDGKELRAGLCKKLVLNPMDHFYSNRVGEMFQNRKVQDKELQGDLENLKVDDDRSNFVHLTCESAKFLTRNGFVTIISVVAPLSKDRDDARISHLKDGLQFLEVFVNRRRDECEAESGFRRNVFNPIDQNYQPPIKPDVHLQSIKEFIGITEVQP